MEFTTARIDSYIFPELTPQALSGDIEGVINSTYTGSGILRLPDVQEEGTNLTIALTATGETTVIDEYSDWPSEEDPITSVLPAGIYFFQVLMVWGRRRWYLIDVGSGQVSGGSSGVINSDIEVFDVNIGGYADEDIIPAGTPIEEILRRMLSVLVAATYDQPTVSISGVSNQTLEVGENVNLDFSITYVQNDAGALIGWTLTEGVSEVHNSSSVDTFSTTVQVIEGSIDYVASVSYDDGPVKNDNHGNPSPTNQILAGTISSDTVSITGERKLFYGVDGSEADIRALSDSLLGPSAGSEVSTGSVSGGNFIISYPATLPDVTALTMLSGGFEFDILSELVQLPNVNVDGANAALPTAYKVFKYEPVAPFTSVEFTATL